MKFLIIEDDVRMADLIKRGLEEEGFEVSVAYDGNMGRKLALNYEFDLIITDIVLPVFNGLELCKEIRTVKPNIPIIMLTALGATDDKIEAFDSGADDYLVKPFDFRELHVRIRTLLKRTNASGNSGFLLKFSDLVMNMQTKTVARAGVEIELTPKEFKFLEYLVRNNGRVLSRREIAEKVWETNFDTGTNFIDVYINYLRKKIDKDFPTKLIHTKSGMGFILKEGS
ncbi:response regulator receiver domain protein [Leptospira fainei serovar Hurstbridge str. BUT 6]|uniref:Response regulator receiver domain protein n=1 Tax=Leptospira fainei serovar Hurstbridge str. BUT 6 TaxID=1193011 RepID=S3W693_9LEPT|nr:response regulator transcription factor [Leptospira fainei]EPG75662.1 response regulator receiver domain protein [Leptospira fainei serovar Hurstbridge str. BUT 6]